jgi:uncharacterized membrane protein HdeD (DUF308 family)
VAPQPRGGRHGRARAIDAIANVVFLLVTVVLSVVVMIQTPLIGALLIVPGIIMVILAVRSRRHIPWL